jgi:hypothetical protein
MLIGALAHRYWAAKHPPGKYSSYVIYMPMVSNMEITEPVADLDSWCTYSTSPIHLYGGGVSSGRHSVVMEVPDGDKYAGIIPSPQGNNMKKRSRVVTMAISFITMRASKG